MVMVAPTATRVLEFQESIDEESDKPRRAVKSDSDAAAAAPSARRRI